MLPLPKRAGLPGWFLEVGRKKPVQLDEELHDVIEDVQLEFSKETGERPPGKEDVIEAGLLQSEPDEIVGELFQKKRAKKKKEKRRREKQGSEFDQLFGL